MTTLRFCRSCSGPRPRAARRCPWCHASYDARPAKPEHLFAAPEVAAPPTQRQEAK